MEQQISAQNQKINEQQNMIAMILDQLKKVSLSRSSGSAINEAAYEDDPNINPLSRNVGNVNYTPRIDFPTFDGTNP